MNRHPNTMRARIATLVPNERWGFFESPVYVRNIGDGYRSETRSSVSAEGMRQMRLEADLFDEMRPTFEALTGRLGRCAHGRDIDELIDDGVLSWSINDYCCDPAGDRVNVFWMLWGMHEGGEWCFARILFRGVVGDYFESSWFVPLLPTTCNSNVVEPLASGGEE